MNAGPEPPAVAGPIRRPAEFRSRSEPAGPSAPPMRGTRARTSPRISISWISASGCRRRGNPPAVGTRRRARLRRRGGLLLHRRLGCRSAASAFRVRGPEGEAGSRGSARFGCPGLGASSHVPIAIGRPLGGCFEPSADMLRQATVSWCRSRPASTGCTELARRRAGPISAEGHLAARKRVRGSVAPHAVARTRRRRKAGVPGARSGRRRGEPERRGAGARLLVKAPSPLPCRATQLGALREDRERSRVQRRPRRSLRLLDLGWSGAGSFRDAG
jgi:hypothetical protein